MLKIKSFLNINMVEEEDLFEFLRQNTLKYKQKHLDEYFLNRKPNKNEELKNSI